MNSSIRDHIIRAISEDVLWVARARTLIEPRVDCSSIEESIARVEHNIARMRVLL